MIEIDEKMAAEFLRGRGYYVLAVSEVVSGVSAFAMDNAAYIAVPLLGMTMYVAWSTYRRSQRIMKAWNSKRT